ncbi:MAG TPA: hypothetical protein VNS32_18770 [Flavisolibacter sp.]|nr:hypothetical protein [Flavisolibacter sp.]
MKKLTYIIAIASLFTAGCRKHNGGGNPPPTPTPAVPGKAVLMSPTQNEACTSGTVISDAQSSIVFKWNAAENAESYDLHIKNLVSGTESTQNIPSTQATVTLNRSVPFSWYVVSKSSKSTTTATSDTWKFYNSGPGTVNYAPFPAEPVAPMPGTTITATGGKITLDWSAGDVDNDIVNYDVYMGTTTVLPIIKEKTSESILNDVSVVSGTTYYWKVVTRDAKGNTSASSVYSFTVN